MHIEHTRSETHRLPKNTVPKEYDIVLEPDLKKGFFSGEVKITIEIIERTLVITLNATDLEIESTKIVQKAKTQKAKTKLDEKKEELTLHVSELLEKGKAVLIIRFKGTLNDKMHGFYRSCYLTKEKKKEYIATTQFEATDARRCFPCFDEPALPATFKSALIVEKEYETISNMPITREEPRGEKKIVYFEETPVMSTYLLVFIVGNFEWLEAKTKSKTLVRVATVPGKKEQGIFALDTAVKVLEFYEDYFEIPYPLPKLDLIAIPDFAAGAMENWGAVTYRETALLIEKENPPAARRQRVAIVIAHETSHQWFGNLVTMDWWTNLWLNEGFASFMEYLAVDELFPEWEIWTQFIADDYSYALHEDGMRSTHPIEVKVKHPSEISQIFDSISYQKGASVIRMIEAYLGARVFRKGLKTYLNRFAYGNATTDDLWKALEEVSKKPVKSIMDSWIKQPGYPVLTIHKKNENTLGIRQTRFLSSPLELTPEEESQLWESPIPLKVITAGEEKEKFVFLKDRETTLTLSAKRDWIKLNAEQKGFLRVNYSKEIWESLKTAVAENKIEVIDRFGLLDDAVALTRAGHMRTPELLSLLEIYKNEDHYIVWTDIAGILVSLKDLLAESECIRNFENFARSVLKPIVKKLGWESDPNDTHTKILLRSVVLRTLGEFGDEEVIKTAKKKFEEYLRDSKALRPDLRMVVYGVVAENSDEKEYETFLDLYRATDLHEEKLRYLNALGQFKNKDLLKRALEFGLSDEVRSQDTIYPFGGVSRNPLGRTLAWEFFKNNWKEFETRYSSGGLKFISYFISAAVAHFASEEKAKEVEQFFKSHPVPSGTRAVEQSLEAIRAKAAWLARDEKAITEWLRGNVK